MTVTTEPPYLHKTQGIAARNGTTSHTLTWSTAGDAPFSAAVGSLIVVIVYGSVTHTTSGSWTEQLSPVNNGELSVFTSTNNSSTAPPTSITITHNGSNYPMPYCIYEFPATSSYTNGNSTNATTSDTFPALTGLTGGAGNERVIIAARGRPTQSASATAGASTWSGSWVEDADQLAVWSTTDGGYLTVGHQINFTGTSITPTATTTYNGGANELGYASDRQHVVFAINAAPVSTSFTKDTQERYRILNTFTKDQAETYRILASLTKDQSDTYRILNGFTKNQSDTYRIFNVFTKDTAELYRIFNGFTKNQAESYRILNGFTKDVSETYRITNAFTKDVAELYNILGTTFTKDVVERYRIFGTFTKDQLEAYRILNGFTKNQGETYRILNGFAKDQSDTYRVFNAFTKDQAELYNILNGTAFSKNVSESYRILNAFTADTVERYRVLDDWLKDVVERYRVLNSWQLDKAESYRVYGQFVRDVVERYTINSDTAPTPLPADVRAYLETRVQAILTAERVVARL